MKNWYVKNPAGKIFGPIEFDTLKTWVKEGRVEPLAGISTDLKNWMLAPMLPELEMNWVVENNPGQFYGPTHRNVIEDLKKTGSLILGARIYLDDRGAANERIRSLEATINERDTEISRRESLITEARNQIAKRDLILSQSQSAIQQRDNRISEQVAQLAQRDSQIDSLSKSIKLKEGSLNQVRDEALRLKAEVERLNQEVAHKTDELAALQKQIKTQHEVYEREWKSDVIEPEVVVADEMPPPTARQAFGFTNGCEPPSIPASVSANAPRNLMDLERRAQEEIARMGSSGFKKMFGGFRN